MCTRHFKMTTVVVANLMILFSVKFTLGIWTFLRGSTSVVSPECGDYETDIADISSRCRLQLAESGDTVSSGLVNEITDSDVMTHSEENYVDNDIILGLSNTSSIAEFLRRLPETGYDNQVRPHVGSKRLTIRCSMYIGSISSVSESNMDMTADIYFRQSWNDYRLRWNTSELGEHDAINIGGDFINFLWRPDTFIPNAKLALYHQVTRHNAFIRITPHGHVTQSIRITVTAQCPMDFRLFPMDNQMCTLQIESFSMPDRDAVYRWVVHTSHSQRIPMITLGQDANSLPQFVIRGFRATEVLAERAEERNHSRLVVEIYFARSLGYYVIQVYLPASLAVVISWVSFWLSRPSQPARVTLGVTTVLALTMMTGQSQSSLPKISYLKALDLFMIFCFAMVFLALIEYAIVSYAIKRSRKDRGKKDPEKVNNEGETILSLITVAASTIISPKTPTSPSPLLKKSLHFFGDSNIVFGDVDLSASTRAWQRPKVPVHEEGWTFSVPASLPSRIEWVSRFAFPLVFLIFNALYWDYFLTRQAMVDIDNIPGFIEYNE